MNDKILQALKENRNWFLSSGVCSGADGFWGVAERLLLTEHNEAIQEALDSFPSWTVIPEGFVIEQRRADCNFQCAWYFLQLSRLFDDEKNARIAHNLLEFLYCRSGLLSHHKIDEPYPKGCWNWSHIRWIPSVYYDDNAWCIILALAIAAEKPEWDAEFQMTEYALAGAQALYQAFSANFPIERADFQPHWNGTLNLPHWGGLAAASLAAASHLVSAEERALWLKLIKDYFDFVRAELKNWNCSELCYSLLTLSITAEHLEENGEYLELAGQIAEVIKAKMKSGTCLLPAEHYEAPSGTELADLIYTMNFATVAFGKYVKVTGNSAARDVFCSLVEFLLAIQDSDSNPRLRGCWRGMYDVSAQTWGGGDHSEGGANSIYTGWTNAPIGWTLAENVSI